jgi:hypothetical protein
MIEEKDNESVILDENKDYITVINFGVGTCPSDSDLKLWRELILEAKNDPDYTIFTHQAVNITRIAKSKDSEKIGEKFMNLFKIGTEIDYPTPQELEDWRDLYCQAKEHPNFSVFRSDGSPKEYIQGCIEEIKVEGPKEE